jgi:hypothetical protein
MISVRMAGAPVEEKALCFDPALLLVAGGIAGARRREYR